MKEQYLKHLARCLSAMSGVQLAAHYFGGNWEAMKRALRKHQAQGLVELSTELVRARANSASPIITIQRGQPTPPAAQITSAAKSRWLDQISPTLVIRGTAKLCLMAGGQPHTAARLSASHEIALADVFFARRSEPEFSWELTRPRPGSGPVPDAIVGQTALELIGAYNTAAVRAKLQISAHMNLHVY